MQTFTARQYLQIDIANSFGLDKLSWDDRIKWFEANKNQLLNRINEAENPALYYAGIKAWNAVEKGEPTGYPISLDATSSGIQILSVLTGDRSAAKLSNVLDTGKRNDAYTSIYEQMARKAGATTQLNRKDVKQAIMTSFYGSEAVPREVFGEGPLLALFFQTLEEVTPAVWELNKAFLELWDPEAMKYSWVLPDNFHVHIKVMDQVQETVEFMGESFTTTRKENRPIEQGRSLGANVVHSLDGFIVRELVRRCDYDPEKIKAIRELLKAPVASHGGTSSPIEVTHMVNTLWGLYGQSGYLSARILDYLDENTIRLVDRGTIEELIDSMPKKPFKIITVHDCFRVHPNYGNDLRQQYNIQLALLAQSNMLQYLLGQVVGQSIPVTKVDYFAPDILDANYALS